jgi:hypothetical protein
LASGRTRIVEENRADAAFLDWQPDVLTPVPRRMHVAVHHVLGDLAVSMVGRLAGCSR